MAVFRVERNKGYTVMSNHHLRNKELTLKAKGLLSQMLSLPEDWDFTLTQKRKINYGFIKYPFHSYPFPLPLTLRGRRGRAAGTERKGSGSTERG